MIVEIAHYALILVLLLSVVQAVGGFMPKTFANGFCVRTQHMMTGLIGLSFLGLIYAFVTSDFSLLLVMKNSHVAKPLLYKISAAWGNHEGSMLLWALILTLWGSLFATRGVTDPTFKRLTLSVQAMIVFGFLIFILMTSNPFVRLPVSPMMGMGFNPMLQDVSLALHPPLLYMGYVGFSIVFAMTIAGLLQNKIDPSWARMLRPWVLMAWSFLTIGIMIGSLWAYYELGWGGFWFWDPVENASLLPWLAGTALLHSISVLEKRDGFKGWVAFLSILTFIMSISGTFLVRSGLLTSVHAFATDPARGMFILGLLAVAVFGSFGLYAWRGPQLHTSQGLRPISRETTLFLNNVFLFSFLVTVFTGTFYPIFIDALSLPPISVGAPYYQSILIPMLFPFALLMGAAPVLAWGDNAFEKAVVKWAVPMLVTIFAVLMFVPISWGMALGIFVSVWIMLGTFFDMMRKSARFKNIRMLPLSYFGFVIAHVGFAVFILGVTFATGWGQEKTTWLTQGAHTEIAGYDVTLLITENDRGKNYGVLRGVLNVTRGTTAFFMTPEKRFYPVMNTTTHETALHVSGVDILYAVLAEQDAEDPSRFVVRLYHHPLMVLVFLGGGLMALGGVVSAVSGYRRRKNA